MTLSKIFQVGTRKNFLGGATVSLGEMKGWMDEWDQVKGPKVDTIGIGAVVNANREVMGELVMTNGEAYMLGKDEKPVRLGDDAKILFAQVAHFAPEKTVTLNVTSEKDLAEQLHLMLGEAPAMVRVNGRFPSIRFRSANAEGRTVNSLEELMKGQSEFPHANLDCELVGLYGPNPGNISFEGLHLHGIDKEHKQAGGHLLGFSSETPVPVQVEIMPVGLWLLNTKEQAQKATAPDFAGRLNRGAARHISNAI